MCWNERYYERTIEWLTYHIRYTHITMRVYARMFLVPLEGSIRPPCVYIRVNANAFTHQALSEN